VKKRRKMNSRWLILQGSSEVEIRRKFENNENSEKYLCDFFH
jgi:hypothetical protein